MLSRHGFCLRGRPNLDEMSTGGTPYLCCSPPPFCQMSCFRFHYFVDEIVDTQGLANLCACSSEKKFSLGASRRCGHVYVPRPELLPEGSSRTTISGYHDE